MKQFSMIDFAVILCGGFEQDLVHSQKQTERSKS